MTIGQAIRSIRKRIPATLEDIAFAANTTASNLSRIELGKHGLSESMLLNVATALGISVSQLYKEAELISAAPHSMTLGSGQRVGTAEMLTKQQTELLEAFERLSKRDRKVVWSLINQLAKVTE